MRAKCSYPNRSLDAAVKQLLSSSLVLNGSQAELASVALKTARAMPQAYDGTFSNSTRAPRIFGDQRIQNLCVPCLGMFDVKHGVNREVQPFLGRDAEPSQCRVDKRGPSGRRHFYHAEGADRMEGVSAMPRKSNHGVTERQSLGNDGLWRRRGHR
jgi:hypothetical protein